ncbi:MAG: bifunctional UDP-sugar hydrolase/5'-nucleotidase [Candidatus Eisenbacteria bacterium]
MVAAFACLLVGGCVASGPRVSVPAGAAVPAPGLPPARAQRGLTILHTNDTHGRLLPFDYPAPADTGSVLAKLPAIRDVGGIARRATLARSIREQAGARGQRVWLVDAGDFCDGTPFSTEYHGEADMAAMNAAGYDYGILGNHEFNGTIAHLEKLVSLSDHPILCGNAWIDATARPVAVPMLIREIGPVKVGLIGLVTHEAASYPAAREGITVEDEVAHARRLVAELRPLVDVVVLFTHVGEEVDERIAREVPGVDVIVGGHSHTRLPQGVLVASSRQERGPSSSCDPGGTIVAQAFQWGGELGRLDLAFCDRPRPGIDRYEAKLLPVTSALPEDPAVREIVERYWKPIERKFDEPIAVATADFTQRGPDLAPYNLVADAERETFGTDVALENLGGVRAPLTEGTITYGDLTMVDPFDNRMVLFEASGAQLREILLRAEPAVSGLRYRIDHGKLLEATVGGEPLDDARRYTVVTHDYFASTFLAGMPLEIRPTERRRLQVIADYLRQKQTVSPVYDGRRIVTRD